MTNQERREFLKAALAAMATATGAAGCKKYDDISVPCYDPVPIHIPNAEQTLRRAELVERLQKLAKSEPPTMLMGAYCYNSQFPHIVEIPCTTCERTMIVGEKDEILRSHNVPLKRIQDQKVDATLIIPEHCAECGFGLKEEKFQLEIKYADQREAVRIELEDAFELELMALFLEGRDRFTELFKTNGWISGGQDHPLKNKVDRLRGAFAICRRKYTGGYTCPGGMLYYCCPGGALYCCCPGGAKCL